MTIPPNTTTLERVARAICCPDGCKADQDNEADEHHGFRAFRWPCNAITKQADAQAALQALREVDEATSRAMAHVIWQSFEHVIPYGSTPGIVVADNVLDAMLDHILSQTPNQGSER